MEQLRQLLGRGDFDAVQKDGFNDGGGEMVGAPRFRRNGAAQYARPLLADLQGGPVQTLEIAAAVPAPEDDEGDQQGDGEARGENAFEDDFGGESVKNGSHSSTPR